MSAIRSPLRSALVSPTYDPLVGRFGGFSFTPTNYGPYDGFNAADDEADVVFMTMFDNHQDKKAGDSFLDETGNHTITLGTGASCTVEGLVGGEATVPDSADWVWLIGGITGVIEVLFMVKADGEFDGFFQQFNATNNQRSWQCDLLGTTTREARFLVSDNGSTTTGTNLETGFVPAVSDTNLYYMALGGVGDAGSGNRNRVYVGQADVADNITLFSTVNPVKATFNSTEPIRINALGSTNIIVKGVRIRKGNLNLGILTAPFTAPLGFGQGA